MTSPPSETHLAPEKAEIVWFSGEDAERFLNDLISQEIADLPEGESRRSFLLSPQGKLDFMFWVTRSGDRLGLIIEGGRGEELANALSRYRIRVNVDITVETASLIVGEAQGVDVSWEGVPRFVATGAPSHPVMSGADYESLRLSAGEPRWGTDVDGSTIPHESGLVAVSVDFDKGCFLGQELVARIDSRGANTPRKLRRLVIDGSVAAGDVLVVEGKEVGVVTSVAGELGLGMVRREVEPGAVLTSGAAQVVVKELGPKLIT